MKIDLNQTFKHVDDADKLTLGLVSFQALNAQSPNQREPLDLDTSMKRGALAIKVVAGGTMELSVDELFMIRHQLPLAWSPIIVAQAAAMLEGS